MKVKEKKEAEDLRKQGWSYNEIAEKIRVSKGSISLWLREMPINEEIKEKLQKKHRLNSIIYGKVNKDRWDAMKKKVRDSYNPPIDDPMFMLGFGLYWGEGDKGNRVRLSNSDPDVQKIFMLWIKDFFPEDHEGFSAHIKHYKPEEDEQQKNFWSKELRLPVEKIGKSNFSVSKISKKKRNTLKHGTLQLAVQGKQVWKIRAKIQKTFEVLRNGG